MTRRALLAGLFAFLKRKRKMAFSPNWLDNPNSASSDWGPEGAEMRAAVRVGTDIYCLAQRKNYPPFTFFRVLTTYKSTDGGVTWTDLAIRPGDNANISTFSSFLENSYALIMFVHQSQIWVFGQNTSNGHGLRYSVLDPANLAAGWTTPVDTTFLASPDNPETGGACGFYADGKPDGSIVTVCQIDLQTVAVNKLVGSTWTSLGTFGIAGSSIMRLNSSLKDSAGNVLVFMQFAPTSSLTLSLYQSSISAASDTLGSMNLIDTTTTTDQPATMVGPGSIASDGTIAIPYGHAMTFSGSGSGTLKVAFGVPTDPLNPTWTTTTVAASQSWDWEGEFMQAQVSFEDVGILIDVEDKDTAYDGSPGTAVATGTIYWTHNSSGSVWQLKRSDYVSGSWTAPAVWFDPSTDPTVGPAIQAVANFFLVHPAAATARRNNYASAGGSLAGPGNYASCG